MKKRRLIVEKAGLKNPVQPEPVAISFAGSEPPKAALSREFRDRKLTLLHFILPSSGKPNRLQKRKENGSQP